MLPLPVLIGGAAVLGYMVLHKPPGSPPTPPSSGGGGGGGGSGTPAGTTPSALGGGSNYVPPGGNVPLDDWSYGGTTLGPGGSNVAYPTVDPTIDSSPGNTLYPGGAFGPPGLGSLSPSVSGMVSGGLVYSPHVGGWVPYYPGHELGRPPPAGLPIY